MNVMMYAMEAWAVKDKVLMIQQMDKMEIEWISLMRIGRPRWFG